MKLTPKGKRLVHDSPSDKYGVYMWRMPNGAYIADGDGHFLSIASDYGNPVKIGILRDAARHYVGENEGVAVFFAGHRKITDEEYEMQIERSKLGLVPDPDDVGYHLDDLRTKKNG